LRLDHCFRRILLDDACGECWYDHIVGIPAYANAPDAVLACAIATGEALLARTADLIALNAQSLAWRGKNGKLTRSDHRRPPLKNLRNGLKRLTDYCA